jgi:hypothetical protein
MTAGLPPPRLVTGYGWQRPVQGRLAHVVPNGETRTLCGLVTARNTWSVVLDADLINGIGWCQSCGERASQESHAASAAIGRIWVVQDPDDKPKRIHGAVSVAEIPRVLAALGARMAQSKKDLLAELDHRMSTSRRGAAEPPHLAGVAPHSIAVRNGASSRDSCGTSA